MSDLKEIQKFVKTEVLSFSVPALQESLLRYKEEFFRLYRETLEPKSSTSTSGNRFAVIDAAQVLTLDNKWITFIGMERYALVGFLNVHGKDGLEFYGETETSDKRNLLIDLETAGKMFGSQATPLFTINVLSDNAFSPLFENLENRRLMEEYKHLGYGSL